MVIFLIDQVPSIHTVCLDLSDIEAASKKVDSLGDIHLLVNNAGIAILGPFEEIKLEDFDKYVFLSYNDNYFLNLLRRVISIHYL